MTCLGEVEFKENDLGGTNFGVFASIEIDLDDTRSGVTGKGHRFGLTEVSSRFE